MAAHQVGVFDDDITILNEPGLPPGCIAYEGDTVQYNTNLTSSYTLDSHYSMICIENPDQPYHHGM